MNVVLLTPDTLRISADSDFYLENVIGKKSDHLPSVNKVSEKQLVLSYKNFDYTIKALSGKFVSKTKIKSENNYIEVKF